MRGLRARRRCGGWALVALLALAALPPAPAVGDAPQGGTAAPAEGSPAAGTDRGQDAWGEPRTIASCGAIASPAVAFPSEAPRTPTGAGVVGWLARAPCGGLSGGWGTWAAALGAGDVPVVPAGAAGGFAQAGALPLLSASGASFGRVALAVGSRSAGAATLLQGRAGTPLRAVARVSATGPPAALARAYLGDLVLAGVAGAGKIEVVGQRHYERAPAGPDYVSIPPGPVTALAAALDFRSDLLLAWQQAGSIYSRFLPASGPAEAIVRVGPSGPSPVISAVVSDNYRAMIAWSSTVAGSGGTPHTRVYLSLSGARGAFDGSPRALASFADPLAAGRSPGALGLVRLSTENVLLAWTAAQGGSYAVHAAQPVAALKGHSSAVSPAGTQAVLASLAAGPAGDALALWESPSQDHGGAQMELSSARMGITRGSRVAVHAAQRLAGAGVLSDPAAAIDPANDRPVAVWVEHAGASDLLRYAVAGGPAAYRTEAGPFAAQGGGTHWLRIAAAALLAAGLAASAVLIARARASRGRRRGTRAG